MPQENLAQQAYAIFEQNCLNCHGEHGAFTEEIIIERTALIETGAVVPREPGASELYQRLIEKRLERRMPLGQPPLTPAAIDTIRRWILADAPNWADTTESDSPFITPKEMLETIEKHVNSLASFDRGFARYFTMTHLYNAGETAEALHAYQRALSKLVNSLSWGRKVTNPQSIDPEERSSISTCGITSGRSEPTDGHRLRRNILMRLTSTRQHRQHFVKN